ncbi:putative transmembrane protein 244 isoform 1-T1 [Acanthopagrus schlegelii]
MASTVLQVLPLWFGEGWMSSDKRQHGGPAHYWKMKTKMEEEEEEGDRDRWEGGEATTEGRMDNNLDAQEDGETRCNKVVLQNLLMCMVCFYSLYYIAVSLCIGLLRVHEINSLLAPFDYTTQPSWQNPKYLVGVISTEVTYLLGGLVFAWIVEEWVWDYAITVTLLHIAMTVAVMSDFPSAEHWWIALGSGLVMMIFGGQLLAYKLFRSNFVYPAELQNF